MNYPPLGKIKIAAPCNAEWQWMYGNDRVRFCGQCNQNVYNLSAMTKEEAEDLIMRTEGRLCVRFYRRQDGTILTKNCPVGIKALKAKLTATRTHIIAAILSFLAYFTGFFWTNPGRMTNHTPQKKAIAPTMGALTVDLDARKSPPVMGQMVKPRIAPVHTTRPRVLPIHSGQVDQRSDVNRIAGE